MGFFDAVAAPFGWVADAVGSDPLTPKAAPIDEGTNQVANQQNDLANRSQGQMVNDRLAGTDQTQHLNQSLQDLRDRQRALGGMDNGAMNQALNNRASQHYERSLNQIQRQAQFDAPGRQSQMLAGANQNKMAIRGANQGIVDRLEQSRVQNEMARNQVISSVMGAAGSIVGSGLGAAMKGNSNGPQKGGGAQSNWQSGDNGESAGPDYGFDEAQSP